jgi:hypothetical protein
MWNPFRKSAAKSLKQAGDLVASGWSGDAPVVYDQRGNVTARCAATALDHVPRCNPRSWGILENVMGGIVPVINKTPGMTQARMVAYFRQAEAVARNVGA